MTNIVILSDTHDNKKAVEKLGEIIKSADLVFHLGDGIRDVNFIKSEYRANVISVRGNCDGVFDDEKVVEVEKVKFMITHGCQYKVKSTYDNIIARGKELGVDFILFGHTHNAICEKIEGVTLFNPGTLNYFSFDKSYGYCSVNGEKAMLKLVPFVE